MVMDPKSASYTPGSQASKLSDQFNQAYSKLLEDLHTCFNGAPSTITAAITFMQDDLRSAALNLIATVDEVTGKNATPTFECV